MKRSTVLMALGSAAVIVGIAVAVIGGRGEDADAADPMVSVLVAERDLEPGMLGDDLLAAGQVRTTRVAESEVRSGALSSNAELGGGLVTASIARGEQLTAGAVTSATVRSSSVEIPEGMQAVAVTVGFTNGGAGYIGPGDRIDVYAVVPPNAPGAPKAPLVSRLLSGVEVLDISNELAPRRAAASTEGETPPRADAGALTVLLAVSPDDAERTIFARSANDLWFTLLPDGAEPVAPGAVTYDSGYLEALASVGLGER